MVEHIGLCLLRMTCRESRCECPGVGIKHGSESLIYTEEMKKEDLFYSVRGLLSVQRAQHLELLGASQAKG